MEEERTIVTSETTAGTAPGSGEQKWARQETEHFQQEIIKKGESLLSEQKGSVANLLNGIANALDKSVPHFEEEGQPNSARYTRKVAESIHGFARDLRERDVESLRRQVTDLARRQPALIAGGAVALGFMASRFLRSSSKHTEQEYREGSESRQWEESLVMGREAGFRAGSSSSSSILTEQEFREKELREKEKKEEFPI